MLCLAAVEGLGIALGRTRLVEADIVAGRLVVPFDVALPADAGCYIVAPGQTADVPTIALFRDWFIASVAPGAVAQPP
jgi:LysR family glycine cleavage system transcriptional activator